MSVRVPTKTELVDNPGFRKSAPSLIAEYLATSLGVFQGLRLAQRTTRLANEIRNVSGHGYSSTLTDLDTKFFMGWAVMGVPRLYGMTKGAIQANQALKEKCVVPGERSRKIEKAIRETTETAALYGHVIGFLGQTKKLSSFANTVDLISDSFDLKIAATDCRLISKAAKQAVLENAEPEVQNTLEQTKRHTMIRIAKAVSAVASGIFGVALAAFGVVLAPAIILIILALASTSLSITGHFYKETKPYKLIDPFEHAAYNLTPVLAN